VSFERFSYVLVRQLTIAFVGRSYDYVELALLNVYM